MVQIAGCNQFCKRKHENDHFYIEVTKNESCILMERIKGKEIKDIYKNAQNLVYEVLMFIQSVHFRKFLLSYPNAKFVSHYLLD